jgi:hypothetical protein
VISETKKTLYVSFIILSFYLFIKLFHRLESLYQSHHLTRFDALEGLASAISTAIDQSIAKTEGGPLRLDSFDGVFRGSQLRKG